MAVQARHISHAFRAMEDATVSGPVFLDEFGGCAPEAAAGFGGTTLLSDVTCTYGFLPRKRARVAAPADGFLEDQRVVLSPVLTQGTVQAPVRDVQQSRAAGTGAPSTSGRMPNGSIVSQDLLTRLYHQGMDIDALITLESERMREGLQEARRRHTRALLAAAERAASGRLRAAEAELERALRRNVELEDMARQMAAECQAWVGVARSHEAVAVGLRATLDQLLQSPRAAAAAAGEGQAEDAQSCCFEAPGANDDSAASGFRATASASCMACGAGEACVLLLPCRHLCLCRACEAAVDACPVCAAAKNASLHVLLS